MASRNVLTEVRDVKLAAELIELGARMQLLEAETSLSRDKLLKLYKELKGVSPPKGMLPFSTDWYMTWMPNVHSSMFYNIYEFMCESGTLTSVEALTRAFRLYLEQTGPHDDVPVLSLTRAWTLIRFFKSDMLQLTQCTKCTGRFVAHRYSPTRNYVCGLCQPPSRAGRSRAPKETSSVAEDTDAQVLPE